MTANGRQGCRHPAGCTIISRNYLSHARILAESYRRHHPGSRFYVLVIDQLPAGVVVDPGVRIIRPEELGLPYFFEMCFKYDVTELSTAVKPSLVSTLLGACGETDVVYLDPDVLILRRLRELREALDGADIVLTPHLLSPIPRDGQRPSEEDILIAGSYNLGFIAVRGSAQGKAFLRWWQERLRDGCRVDPGCGLMTDQRWVDLVPGLFPGTRLLRDPTYNVAYWNLHERLLRRRGGRFVINGRPLAFYHFSGFNPDRPHVLSKHQTRTRLEPGSALGELFRSYAELHAQKGHPTSSLWDYGYARFDSGVAVHPLLRKLYLQLDDEARARFGDPFRCGGTDSFLHWATTARVESTGLTPFQNAVYQARLDIRAAFPDVRGRDRQRFLAWARRTGPRELGYDARLVPGAEAAGEPPAQPGGAGGLAGAAALPTPVADAVVVAAVAPEPVSAGPSPAGINVCGYLRNESGLGAAVRGYVRAIRAAEIPHALKDISDMSVNRSKDPTLPREDREHPYGINLYCVNADQHFTVMAHLGERFFRGRHNIGIWAWELPRFPAKWYDRFPYYDEIWVGTSFIANVLAPVCPVPVVRVPPVMTGGARGCRTAGRRRLGVGADTFVFLFIFDFHSYFQRKNPLAVVQAFKHAFPPSARARLVIKCVNEQASPTEFAALQEEARGHPVSIRPGYWTAGRLRDLMAAADAYVSLHRSEGTGLTISDAMALGKPVIATGWSGNMDFMTVANSFPVRYRLVELDQHVGPYRAGEVWADASVEHAAELMRYVHDNRDAAADRGQAGRRDIEAYYSEAAVGALIRQRFEVLLRHDEFESLRRGLREGRVAPQHVVYRHLVRRVREVVESAVAPGATVVVVSRGDDDLLRLGDGRRGWHFPQEPDGTYAGHYPADGPGAVAQVEAVRAKGGQFLVFPSTALWWLEHYRALREHLEANYRAVVRHEACVIYELAGVAGPVGGSPGTPRRRLGRPRRPRLATSSREA
jgi:glycosyltransferase involved in cell wall biosynthesis